MVESHISTKVEIFLCARNLANTDTFSKSDPFCTVFLQNPQSSHYHKIGQTEIIRDNLNPNWRTSIIVDYYFEMKQNLKFSVLDYDESSPDALGDVFISMGELMSKGTSILNLSKKGKLVIRVEEVKQSNDLYTFHMKGIKLDKKDLFGKSDPYLIFYRNVGQNSWTEVHRTEVIKNTLDPIWLPIHISGQKLCNGDLMKPIKIECFDWDRVGSHDLIGIAEVNLSSLENRGFKFELFENADKKKKNKKSGTIEVTEVIKKKVLSFVDYLRAGVQISLSIAIDFTASNGEYSSRNSLHFSEHNNPNQYERAIWEVGSILEAYDSDKLFPVFGFGGVPRGERSANHCFPLTFDHNNPYVQGIPGVISAYHASLQRVSLSGPTLFHHIIDSAASVARSVPAQQGYQILLILTDGAIMDMEDTIRSVVAASALPMSIIIVGVGNADFSSMEALDCDTGFLTDSAGRRAGRDIVQFVPFYQFGGNQVALAAEVLREVPKQLTDFMGLIGYSPEIPEMKPIESYVPIDTLPPLKEVEVGRSSYNYELPPLDLPSDPHYQTFVPDAPELPEEEKSN